MLCAFCLQVEQLQAKVVIGILLIAVKKDVTFSHINNVKLKLYTTCMYKYRTKASYTFRLVSIHVANHRNRLPQLQHKSELLPQR